MTESDKPTRKFEIISWIGQSVFIATIVFLALQLYNQQTKFNDEYIKDISESLEDLKTEIKDNGNMINNNFQTIDNKVYKLSDRLDNFGVRMDNFNTRLGDLQISLRTINEQIKTNYSLIQKADSVNKEFTLTNKSSANTYNADFNLVKYLLENSKVSLDEFKKVINGFPQDVINEIILKYSKSDSIFFSNTNVYNVYLDQQKLQLFMSYISQNKPTSEIEVLYFSLRAIIDGYKADINFKKLIDRDLTKMNGSKATSLLYLSALYLKKSWYLSK